MTRMYMCGLKSAIICSVRYLGSYVMRVYQELAVHGGPATNWRSHLNGFIKQDEMLPCVLPSCQPVPLTQDREVLPLTAQKGRMKSAIWDSPSFRAVTDRLTGVMMNTNKEWLFMQSRARHSRRVLPIPPKGTSGRR